MISFLVSMSVNNLLTKCTTHLFILNPGLIFLLLEIENPVMKENVTKDFTRKTNQIFKVTPNI